MAITAFFAALLGGILAPIVSDGMRSLSEVEFPEFDFPEIKRKTNKGREFDELAKPISSLFKVAAGKLITNAIERLQKSQ